LAPKVTEKAAKPAASTASTKIGRYSLIVVSSLHGPDCQLPILGMSCTAPHSGLGASLDRPVDQPV